MDLTVEEKLRLLQKIREDAGTNENAMKVRSSLVSGYDPQDESAYIGQGNLLSLKFRTFFSIVLFGSFLLMYFCGFRIGSFSGTDVVAAISAETDTNLFDFTAYLPYTLEE